MTDRRVDVLIVGGGPAGLAAAIVLGRNDLDVVVCERREIPRDKACGEGLMPTGVESLAQLGARQFLDERQIRPLAGIHFHSTAGDVATARFADGHGMGIRRTNLSAALFQATQGCASVEIRQKTAVRRLELTARGVRVQIGTDTLTARLVIGADGLYSRIRRWAGLEGPPQRLRRLGARQHFALDVPEPFVNVLQGCGIEAYLTPCGRGATGVAFIWDPALYRHAEKGDRLIASLLAAFPRLERRLSAVAPLNEPVCCGPLHRVARRRASDGILLIGDAGGYIDACSGEGISLALAQALALETTVVPALKQTRSVLTLGSLKSCVDACQEITRPYKIGTRIQLYLCRHPRLANRIVRALASNEDITARWLSANMGRAPFWPGWRAGLRLLKAMACPS